MSYKIGSDVNRFKDIVRGKVKSDLKKYVSSQDLLGQTGGKTVKIPINNIDLPHFTYGNQIGGAGAGEGQIGDGIGDGDPKKGDGKGKAGNEKGEHQFSVDFTPEELAQMLGEELELPNIEPKNKGKVGSSKVKYNSINRQGTEGLRHFRRTYKEALKRSISSGSYDPVNPIVIPIKDDRRYKAPTQIETPEVNCVVIYMLDCSGSISDEMRHICQSEVFWIDSWLSLQYKGLETRFIVHDTEAQETTREDFFKINSGGGTSISSAYKLASDIVGEEYPVSEWNTYLFHYSDGDNWSNDDNMQSIELLKNNLLPNCNLFGYEQISTPGGSGEFYNILEGYFPNETKILINKTENKNGILAALKFFLGKGR